MGLYEAMKEVDVFSNDKEATLKGKKVAFIIDEKLTRTGYIIEKIGEEDEIPAGSMLL